MMRHMSAVIGVLPEALLCHDFMGLKHRSAR